MTDFNDTQGSLDLLVKEKTKIEEPKEYKVILHNDDFTPMDFVIKLVIRVFQKNFEEAKKIVLKVHLEGVGICGVFSYQVAETKMYFIHQLAKEHGFPLRASIEAV